MSKTTVIGCRLPSGLVLEIAGKGRVELAGQRQAQERSPIILLSSDDYGTTEVDADFWEAWKKQVGPSFAPLASNAIFEVADEKSAKAKARELSREKTGFEAMSQEAPGVKADV